MCPPSDSRRLSASPAVFVKATEMGEERPVLNKKRTLRFCASFGRNFHCEKSFRVFKVSEEFKALQADVNHINWARRKMYYAPHIEEIARSLNIPNPNFKKSKGDMLAFGRNNGKFVCNFILSKLGKKQTPRRRTDRQT